MCDRESVPARPPGERGCMVVPRTLMRFFRDCVSQRRKSEECYVSPAIVATNGRSSFEGGMEPVKRFHSERKMRRLSKSSPEICASYGSPRYCDKLVPQSKAVDDLVWRVDSGFDEISIGKTLGRGHFGVVYQAVLRGKVLAIKIIKQDSLEGSIPPPAERMLTGMTHPNLICIYEVKERQEGFHKDCHRGDNVARISFSSGVESVDSWCRSSASSDFLSYLAKAGDQRETWVFMEYCDRGALWEAVKRGDFKSDVDSQRPCWLRIVSVSVEVASAMSHLHAAGIIHGDLKPHNVLLKTCEHSAKGFIAKVGDFGLSKPSFGRTHVSVICHGTVDHMPPEVLKDGYMSAACDVFSFGILLWELCTGQKPFKGLQQAAIVVAIVEGHRPTIPQTIPGPLASLIQDCWHQQPHKRPTFQAILVRLQEMELDALRWERTDDHRVNSRRRVGISVPPTE